MIDYIGSLAPGSHTTLSTPCYGFWTTGKDSVTTAVLIFQLHVMDSRRLRTRYSWLCNNTFNSMLWIRGGRRMRVPRLPWRRAFNSMLWIHDRDIIRLAHSRYKPFNSMLWIQKYTTHNLFDRGITADFQLHVMDSQPVLSSMPIGSPLLSFNSMLWIRNKGNIWADPKSIDDILSTPCYGFIFLSLTYLPLMNIHLSTPCYGFCTMGGVVLVYPAVITYFY